MIGIFYVFIPSEKINQEKSDLGEISSFLVLLRQTFLPPKQLQAFYHQSGSNDTHPKSGNKTPQTLHGVLRIRVKLLDTISLIYCYFLLRCNVSTFLAFL
jgi:hypothetical protein